MDRTSLSDSGGRERLVYVRNSNLPPFDGLTPIQVIVMGPTYELKAQAVIGWNDRVPSELTAVALRAQGDASYELWGIGDYRVEGPLLALKLTGDQLGHFRVRVTLTEASLRMTDEFETDQSCLSLFLRDLQAIGQPGDA